MATKAEIRLQIVTALDKAGIKATKEQVDMMSASVMDANRKMGKSANESAGALGRMRGPVGKLTNAFSNLGGTMGKVVGVTGMVVGAFETGWAVGTKLREGIAHIAKEWFHYKSKAELAAKAHRQLVRAQNEAAEQFDKSFERAHLLREQEMADSKAALEQVKLEAEAYRTAAKAKMGLLTAGMGAEEQRLERERFEDVLTLHANGYDSAAVEQVEAVYDVLKAELAVKKELAKIDAAEDAAIDELSARIARALQSRVHDRETALEATLAAIRLSLGNKLADQSRLTDLTGSRIRVALGEKSSRRAQDISRVEGRIRLALSRKASDMESAMRTSAGRIRYAAGSRVGLEMSRVALLYRDRSPAAAGQREPAHGLRQGGDHGRGPSAEGHPRRRDRPRGGDGIPFQRRDPARHGNGSPLRTSGQQ